MTDTDLANFVRLTAEIIEAGTHVEVAVNTLREAARRLESREHEMFVMESSMSMHMQRPAALKLLLQSFGEFPEDLYAAITVGKKVTVIAKAEGREG